MADSDSEVSVENYLHFSFIACTVVGLAFVVSVEEQAIDSVFVNGGGNRVNYLHFVITGD